MIVFVVEMTNQKLKRKICLLFTKSFTRKLRIEISQFLLNDARLIRPALYEKKTKEMRSQLKRTLGVKSIFSRAQHELYDQVFSYFHAFGFGSYTLYPIYFES